MRFKEYDELGLPKNDGFDYYKYITTEQDTLDNVIEASPDQMQLAMHPTGERYDIDKEENEMNAEGKQITLYPANRVYFHSCREGSICRVRGK